MSDYSDHPLVAAAKKHGTPGDELVGRTVSGFVNLDAGARAQVLADLERLMTADDGANLRQKSRLINMHRGLAATHRQMQKANR